MTPSLWEAFWWAVALIMVAIVIAAGARIVWWITEGDSTNVWKAALVLLGASVGGGTAMTIVMNHRNGDNHE